MDDLSFQQQAVIWGQAYEILVKRGVLGCLAERELIRLDTPHLMPWRHTKLLQVYQAVIRQLDIVDETVRKQTLTALQHLAAVSYGLGYTAMREYLKHLNQPLEHAALTVRALWCPLTLPGPRVFEADRNQACTELHDLLGLKGIIDPALADKGRPARADFLLWLSGEHKEDHLLIQEYAYDMPAAVGDFHNERAHLDELLRHRRLVDSRGVFARVSAEVEEEKFALSEDIRTHLGALTAENKPFYKLCQGASYAASTLGLLTRHGLLTKPCVARALAITLNGVESLAARYIPSGTKDPRLSLMRQMGAAYRQATKPADGDAAGLTNEVEAVFRQLLSRLPKALRAGLKAFKDMPKPGEDYHLEFEETVPDFTNPMQRYTKGEALALVEDSAALESTLGQPATRAIQKALDDLCPSKHEVTLRDLHAAAIVAGLSAAKTGQLTVLGLEGNPGIGKTTAVVRYLSRQDSGYLFFYVSPRVVINRDVTEKLARQDGAQTGILTVTTNAQIIASAERYHRALVDEGKAAPRHIDGAVIVDGVRNLKTPQSSVLVLTPEQENDIERRHAGSRLAKTTLSENEDMVEERSLVGVLAAMASVTRELLPLNPKVNRAVLTAALQGFREKGHGRTTMESLSRLFHEHREGRAKTEERRRFAARMPTIVVMVDELAGDGAGAPFVHAVAQWLKDEFLEPFAGEDSPFKVILVVSDASLANEVVLDRYINAGKRSPDKVLVSRSHGHKPFALATTRVRLGSGKPKVFHVMTNSYPARALSIHYRVNLTSVRLIEKQPGQLETPRQAVRRVADEVLLENAADDIRKAVAAGAMQVIYFAQDKLFLRSLRELLSDDADLGLNEHNVQILDSSIPGSRRKQLIEEHTRDTIKVFLMTSSGARGVSFPKTDWIIAAIPRFNIEAALMEIAQLIYRGRGLYHDEQGNEVSGDDIPRRLVLRIDDFLIHEETIDKRQWLRQSIDLMTLLVMLRATILTRITGDAGLQQSLAVVPVGGVGVEELMSLMSQYVTQFIAEADTFVRGAGMDGLKGLVASARTNCYDLFSRFRLHATARKSVEGSSFVKEEDAREFLERTSSALASLLPDEEGRASIPAHVYFAGPMILEHWSHFDKREAFSFEGHRTDVDQMNRALYMQLKDIDQNPAFPTSLRIPAANLLRLLAREKPNAANEFSTLKDLKSPNTWIVLPATYTQFVRKNQLLDDRPWVLEEPDIWREGLGRTLSTSNAVMPAIPSYDGLPWAAGICQSNPLKFDVVFDDRYFMASNELNLLNTLLLTASDQDGNTCVDNNI